jgi:uncharacterized protein (TIRG00374 family)
MALGLLFSLACLVLALYDIDLQEAMATLRNTDGAWLAASLGLVALMVVAKGLRWRLILQPAAVTAAGQPVHLGLGRLTAIWIAGASLNLAQPAPRTGDLARAYLGGEASGLSKSLVLGTVATEKLFDMVMLAACFLGLLTVVVLPVELAQRQAPVLGAAILVLALAAVAVWQRPRLLQAARWLLRNLPARWRVPFMGMTERAIQGLEALRQPWLVAFLVVWSAVIWFLMAATNNAVLVALGQPGSWVQSVFVLVVLTAGVAIPSSPGKVGVFQVLCRWSLGVFGVSASVGLAYGILLYLVAVVSQMLAGALVLLLESWRLRRTPVALGSLVLQGEETLQDPARGQL